MQNVSASKSSYHRNFVFRNFVYGQWHIENFQKRFLREALFDKFKMTDCSFRVFQFSLGLISLHAHSPLSDNTHFLAICFVPIYSAYICVAQIVSFFQFRNPRVHIISGCSYHKLRWVLGLSRSLLQKCP